MKKVVCNVLAVALLACGNVSCHATGDSEIKIGTEIMENNDDLLDVASEETAAKVDEEENAEAIEQVKTHEEPHKNTKSTTKRNVLKGVAIAGAMAVAIVLAYNRIVKGQSFNLKDMWDKVASMIYGGVNSKETLQQRVKNAVSNLTEKVKNAALNLWDHFHYGDQGVSEVQQKCFPSDIDTCEAGIDVCEAVCAAEDLVKNASKY